MYIFGLDSGWVKEEYQRFLIRYEMVCRMIRTKRLRGWFCVPWTSFAIIERFRITYRMHLTGWLVTDVLGVILNTLVSAEHMIAVILSATNMNLAVMTLRCTTFGFIRYFPLDRGAHYSEDRLRISFVIRFENDEKRYRHRPTSTF